MTKKVPNVQFYPTATRIELNDKDTKILFNLNPEYFAKMIEEGTAKAIIEKRKGKGKKQKEVVSLLLLENANGYTLINVLDEYDRAVFGVVISEYLNGNRYLTPAIIYRGLTGKVGKSDAGLQPNPQQVIEIRQSIDKLMCTLYDPQVIKSLADMGYDVDAAANDIIKAPILPCERVAVTINGKSAKEEVIHINGKPALLRIADIKSQVVRYPVELLDVPNQQNTHLNISIKNYVLRRVVEIIKHSMTPTITLTDVFKKCRIEETIKNNPKSQPRVIKLRARECISALFEHLKGKGMIEGLGEILEFEWKKKRNSFDKICFRYNREKDEKKPDKRRQ